MKKRKTILFDLDGTLLPLNQEEFVRNYFGRLAMKMAPHGLEKDTLVKGLMIGMKAMQDNDGQQTNSEAFWKVFEQLTATRREAIPSFLYIAMLIIFFLSLIFGNRKKYGWKLILIQTINLISSLPIIILGIGYFLLGMTS